MKLKTLYSFSFMLVLLGLQNALLNYFVYGLSPFTGVSDSTRVVARANHLVRGGSVFESFEVSRFGRLYSEHPPGYSVFYAIFDLLTFDNHEYTSFSIILILNLVYFLIILLIGLRIFGKYGSLILLLYSVYPAYPSVIFDDDFSVSMGIKLLYLDLNGTNTDLFFITLALLFSVKFIDARKSGSKYISLFLLANFSHGIAHASRFIAFDLTLILCTLFIALFYGQKGKDYVLNKMLQLAASCSISMFGLYITYYYPFLSSQGKEFESELFEVLPSYVSLTHTLIFSVVLFILSIVIYFYLIFHPPKQVNQSIVLDNTSINYFIHYGLMLSLISSIVLFSYKKATDPNIYLQDPFYLDALLSISSIFEAPIALLNLIMWFFIFLIAFKKSNNFVMFFLMSLITFNSIFFLFSIVLDIHPARMSLLIYFKSFIFTLSTLILLEVALNKKKMGKEHYRKALAFGLIFFLVFSNYALLALSFLGNSPTVSEIQTYDNRLKTTPITENIIISSNLINYLDEILVGEEYVLTAPHSQEMIGAIYSFNIVSEDSVRYFIYDYDVNDFFNRFNFTYFVLINIDINSPGNDVSILDTKLWDSNPNLEIIYHNSLGERVYRYSK